MAEIRRLKKNADKNQVPGVRLLSHSELVRQSPGWSGQVQGALYAPTGGVVCPYSLVFALCENAAENGVDFTMVAHVAAPAITGSDLPSTMSGRMVGILRYDLGFNGVIITDALNMGAIANNYTTSAACVSAVQAGVDMLLMPVSLDEAYSSIANAVSDGTISEDRIDQSIKRILNAKMRRGLFG